MGSGLAKSRGVVFPRHTSLDLCPERPGPRALPRRSAAGVRHRTARRSCARSDHRRLARFVACDAFAWPMQPGHVEGEGLDQPDLVELLEPAGGTEMPG